MTLPLPSSPHWPPTRMMTTGLLGARFGPARLQVVEPSVFAAEFELDHACRAVAVFGDVQLGDAGPLVRFVVLGPEQKHYKVTILFDASAFSQVAQDGALVRALFWRTAELRDGDNWNAKLTSQSLERSGNRRHLLDAVVIASSSTMHQLQVVDEDHVYAMAHLRLARFELQAQLVHHRRVVDIDLCLTQWAKGI